MLLLSGGEEGEAKLSAEDPSWKPGPRLLPIPAGTKDALCIPNSIHGNRRDLVLITLLVTVLEKEIERNGWLNKGKQNEVLC